MNILHYFIPVAHAQTFPTSTVSSTDLNTFVSGLITYFWSLFWTPYGLIVSAAILLALIGMVVRKVRGMARRPH